MELTRTKVLNPLVLLNSADQCLDYFRGRSHETASQACLVFIDLVMPGRSGIDLLKALRDLTSARSSVFVILSGLADHKMISEGYAHGARTFLTKPVSYEEVHRTLSRVPGIQFIRQRNGFELLLQELNTPIPRKDSALTAPILH
jgi:FixJ family two-component response regulator